MIRTMRGADPVSAAKVNTSDDRGVLLSRLLNQVLLDISYNIGYDVGR